MEFQLYWPFEASLLIYKRAATEGSELLSFDWHRDMMEDTDKRLFGANKAKLKVSIMHARGAHRNGTQ